MDGVANGPMTDTHNPALIDRPLDDRALDDRLFVGHGRIVRPIVGDAVEHRRGHAIERRPPAAAMAPAFAPAGVAPARATRVLATPLGAAPGVFLEASWKPRPRHASWWKSAGWAEAASGVARQAAAPAAERILVRAFMVGFFSLEGIACRPAHSAVAGLNPF